MSTTIPNKRPAPIDISQQIAEARRRAAEVKARLEAQQAAKNGTAPATATSATKVNGTSTAKSAAQSARERVEALKARVAAATMRTQAAPPIRSLPVAPVPTFQTAEFDDFSRTSGGGAARGGLAVGIHPSLLGDMQDRGKSTQRPKSKAQSRVEEVQKGNPYLSETATAGRAKRTLNFTHNLHARPAMQAANEMRRKTALEQMKKRIQAQAAKAGLDESSDIQVFAVSMPPEVEFWDEGLQSGIEGNEVITRLVIHPILIEPPQEKFITLKPQPLKLTKKEQKKVRRIRRTEEHKEEQAKIRLGLGEFNVCSTPCLMYNMLTLYLVPTPAPKVKHSNVMRVYGELAVKDPTAVEAMVNKQVAERKEAHITSNAERQLTKEEKAEKIALKAKENAALGLNMCVFKIALTKDKLLGKHRYKIDVNAKQHHDVTGVVLVAPSMTLCLIEGGEHSIRKYKHLMLNRIPWQAILEGEGEAQNNDQDPEDSRDTTCTLLWQGQIRDRKFKKWGSIREVETEALAKEVLTKSKMDSFWTLAKSSSN